MNGLDCDEVVELAPELALDLVCGPERAAALSHLDSCASCQELVTSLTGVSDQLLLLTPSIEPPPGFDRHVLEPLTAPVPVSSRRRRRPMRVAVLAVAACLAALALVVGVTRSGAPSVVTAAMRTRTGDAVGTVSVLRQPAVLEMTLPGWSAPSAGYPTAADAYFVRIEHTGGPPQLVPARLNAAAAWATALEVDPGTVTGVAIVDGQGRVWCEAQLATPR